MLARAHERRITVSMPVGGDPGIMLLVHPALRTVVLALAAGAASACASTHVDAPTHPPQAPPQAVAAPVQAPAPAPKPAARELPRGGRTIFPAHRLVGFCGTPGAPALGQLAGDLAKKAAIVEKYAAMYAEGRTPLPAFELIATIAQAGGGSDGKYRSRVEDSVVDRYLKAARDAKAILLLAIQPGQSDFLSELKHFEKYLHEPDVGVALDPEWLVKPGQRPGKFYGHTTGVVLDEVATYLEAIVAKDDLPEKVLVFHQLAAHIVSGEESIKSHPGVVVIKSVDGLGPRWTKIVTYNVVIKTLPATAHAGFKLFFDEDTRLGDKKLMTPTEVLALRPQPEYIMYE
jgi:hypothetical protein